MYFPYEETFIFMVIYYIFSGMGYLLAPKIDISKLHHSKEVHSYHCLYNAFIHAFTTTILVIIKISLEGIKDGDIPSNFSYIILAHSLGYFMHDFVKNQLLASIDITSELHHIICLYGFATTLTNEYGGTEISNGMILAEFSNIFLKLRALMKFYNLKNNKLYFINELIFAIVFLLLRIVIGPLYTFSWIFHPKTPLVTVSFGTLLNLVSVIWISEILVIICLKLAMNPKSRFVNLYKKISYGLKESRNIKILFYSLMIVPQLVIEFFLYQTLR